jgi:hypothetical protein
MSKAKLFVSLKGGVMLPVFAEKAREALLKYAESGKIDDEEVVLRVLAFLVTFYEDVATSTMLSLAEEMVGVKVTDDIPPEITDEKIEELLADHDCKECPAAGECPIKPMVDKAAALYQSRKHDKQVH